MVIIMRHDKVHLKKETKRNVFPFDGFYNISRNSQWRSNVKPDHSKAKRKGRSIGRQTLYPKQMLSEI